MYLYSSGTAKIVMVHQQKPKYVDHQYGAQLAEHNTNVSKLKF